MKAILSTLIISSLLAKDIASFTWQTWFYINQQEIAAEKCENKAIPMMHCNGKCYLSKQLKKLEQKEQENNSKTNPFSALQKTVISLNFNKIELPILFVETNLVANYFYLNTYSNQLSQNLLKPPIC